MAFDNTSRCSLCKTSYNINVWNWFLITGFTGDTCETNIDDCVYKECRHGTCIDGVQKAFCQCPVGKMGATCDKGKWLINF